MKEKIATISILANMILAGGKISIGVFSNSAAILAAGLDSFADIFSSVISYIGIKISGKPADEKHPYGHYKFEVLAGVIITMIIFATGIGIFFDAYRNFSKPSEMAIGYLAFGVMIFSALLNELMARLKIHYGKKEGSVSLLSDGTHSRIDVYTSLAILAGLFLSRYWNRIDVILALLMGAYIIKESFLIGKEAVGSLLDVAAGPETEAEIIAIAKSQSIEIEDLKTQKKGSAITANFKISLPSDLNVAEAAKISGKLRKELIEKIERLQYVAIQIASHSIETDFYKPDYGQGFGWQRKGRFTGEVEEAASRGPEGECVCEKCGCKTAHQKGTPCSKLVCPNCGTNLKRE
jgi:cation diffusion facilitator family transporter